MASALLDVYHDLAGVNDIDREGFLALVDAPTGVGKTYQVCQFFVEHLLESSGKKIIYSTNLKKNVLDAYNQLKDQINSSSYIDLETKKKLLGSVIFIPSQEDAISALSDKHWDVIYKLFPQAEIKDINILRSCISILKTAQHSGGAEGELSSDIRIKTSKLFNLLVYNLRRLNKENNHAVNTKLQEVIQVFLPASKLDDDGTQVIFMTTAKLMLPWQGVQGSFRISDLLNKVLVVLDEFDRQQDEILKHLIESPVEVDIIDVLRRIYAGFSTYRVDASEEFAGIDKSFDKFREKLTAFGNYWHLNCRMVLSDNGLILNEGEGGKVFSLLSDRMSIHTANFGLDELRYMHSKNEELNVFGKDGDISGTRVINETAKLLRAFSNAMLGAIKRLEKNHVKINQGNNSDAPIAIIKPHTTNDMISKLLNHFGLASLREEVLSLLGARLSFTINKEKRKYSYHEFGFEISNICKTSDIDNTITAKTFDLSITPSGLLAHWVDDGAQILGISATASAKTAIHNFDINYLNSTLKNRLKQPDEVQKLNIQSEYENKRQYKNKGVKINVLPISPMNLAGGLKKLVERYKGKNLTRLEYSDWVQEATGVYSGKINFHEKRLARLIAAIQYFAKHKTNRYMFCMLGRKFTTDEFSGLINWLAQQYDLVVFTNINAGSFKNGEFDNVIQQLENTSKKIVVVTNYQATGAGLSPCYRLKDSRGYIYVGPEPKTSSDINTDIDSIYIEQPKSLIGGVFHVQQSQSERTTMMRKSIHQTFMMFEQAYMREQEVKGTLNKLISSKLHEFSTSELSRVYQNSPDYQHATYRFIEQALGRMCRTEWKQPEITILFDDTEKFMETLAKDMRPQQTLSFEYRGLINKAKELIYIDHDDSSSSSYSPASMRNWSHIQRLITSVFRMQAIDSIAQYEKLRNQVLSSPTVSDPNVYYVFSELEGSYQFVFEQSPESGPQIFINPVNKTGLREVSAESAKLSLLVQNPVIREYFSKNNIALKWSDSPYVLMPAMFDIYMGAVGEEAIKALLKSEGYSIEVMKAGYHEWFDGYISTPNSIILVDIKHWELRTMTTSLEDKTVGGCAKKLHAIRSRWPEVHQEDKGKAFKALYINVIAKSRTDSMCEGFSIFPISESEEGVSSYIQKPSNVYCADMISVSGIIDPETGLHDTKGMMQLIDILGRLS